MNCSDGILDSVHGYQKICPMDSGELLTFPLCNELLPSTSLLYTVTVLENVRSWICTILQLLADTQLLVQGFVATKIVMNMHNHLFIRLYIGSKTV